MPTCDGIIFGDPRSPNGSNQSTPCPHAAKFHIRREYVTQGRTFEENVCGVHAKRARADAARDERLAAAYVRCGADATPSRIVTITPLAQEAK